jgi:hypothetical protein
MELDVDLVEILGKAKINDVVYGTTIIFNIIDITNKYKFEIGAVILNNDIKLVLSDDDLVKYEHEYSTIYNAIINKYTLDKLLKL